MKSILLFLCFCVSAVAAFSATQPLTFDANNDTSASSNIEFIAQRKLTSAPAEAWAIVVTSRGEVIGTSSRASGTVTVARAAYTLTASADFFLSTDVGKTITWGGAGAGSDTVVHVAGPRSAVTITSGTITARTVTLSTARVQLNDTVPPGVWSWRVAARTVGGTKLSAFTNEISQEVEPYGPSTLAALELGGLINISTRSDVRPGDGAAINGFAIRGEPVRLLIRGVGPSLTRYGIADPLPNPRLRIMRGAEEIARNDNWDNAPELIAAAAVSGAFALDPDSTDAALIIVLSAGVYTAICEPTDARGGIGLAEVYQLF